MTGMNTVAELYLDSEPTQVATRDEQLVVVLADEDQIVLPLHLVSQLAVQNPLPEDAEILRPTKAATN